MKTALLFALLSLTLYADAHLFVYHRFGDSKHASTNVSLETLKKQFDYFKNNHYEVIPLSKLNQALKDEMDIPDNWVVFCIDDSYKSFYTNGLSLFKEYKYPFTLFVYIEATNKGYGDFMTWEQIKDTQNYGEIGLHSYAHKHMVSMSKEAIKKDTDKAFTSFISHLGYSPKYYAYPFGEFDERVQKEISSYGFDLVLNQNVGAVSSKSPRGDLDRIALTGDVNLKYKLRIKYLDAQWHSPKNYPDNAKLNEIHVTMPPSIKKAELYVSGGGWEYIKLKDGVFKSTKTYPLKFKRTRVIIKYGNAYTSKIIVKK
ncbi:polysaccharide deacetylase family protein [Sulfurimonas sp. MAG313]|nr:polysaccharide deacetylase family protein [Sulfurimonas sp. MAG313]MDF1881078.1 polysaccharide deacetylase family protein [Sulfurimonas sp. MAG313]